MFRNPSIEKWFSTLSPFYIVFSPLKENLCFGAVLAGEQTYLAYFLLSSNTTRQTLDDLNILQGIHTAQHFSSMT